jgi:hypothetical protein
MTNLRKKLINNNILSYLKKNYLTPRIIGISLVSLFLLVQFSPVFSILWLWIATLYFIYIRNYKDISKIWGFTIGMWYLIFTTSLAEVTILIGFENTRVIINYLLDNDFLFESLCFQTVYILDALSAKLGFSIYIPAVVNIFSFFSKLFKNDKSGCSGKGDSGEKKNSSWFFSGKTEKSQSEVDMPNCEPLAKKIEKCAQRFHASNSTTDGKRTVTYSKTWIPGFGVQTNCHARDATMLEKELYNNAKKK